MKNHCTLQYHKDSMEILRWFVKNHKNSEKHKDHSANTKTVETVKENKEYRGRQGMALRGHRDDDVLFKYDDEAQNEGNFRELVTLMADLDKDLKNFVMTCKQNATYLSKSSQNELLLCIKEYIQQEIVIDIKNQNDSHFFRLSANKVTDIFNWEQLGINVHYMKDCEHIEDFCNLFHVKILKENLYVIIW